MKDLVRSHRPVRAGLTGLCRMFDLSYFHFYNIISHFLFTVLCPRVTVVISQHCALLLAQWILSLFLYEDVILDFCCFWQKQRKLLKINNQCD